MKLGVNMIRHEQVVDLLVQSLRLADKRNTVAHSPMRVQVWEQSKTGEVLFEQVIASQTTDNYIDDAELAELRAAAEDISTRLIMALGYHEPQHHAR